MFLQQAQNKSHAKNTRSTVCFGTHALICCSSDYLKYWNFNI